ncbi:MULTISPECIES: STAS domain-containing protein [unclassified Yoonia]|uniref:STAS domain-containing protein n=1 Tax=unclassified Yoonia TaxID=2629118 RepID=UPI002AFED2F5|nr:MULTISPECIES: STAS domain-containing protein [unclassified Yoonia]
MTATPATFVLPAALTFDACDDLYSVLLKSQGADLVLDGSHVTRISGLAAQLLATASMTWALAGRHLTIANPSGDLRRGLEILALWPLPQQNAGAV